MKMVFIVYNEAIEDEVMEVLKAHSVDSYTQWTKVLGKGQTSGPHLLTHIWPKANNVLMICLDDEKVSPLLEGIRRLRNTLGREGVKGFVIPVETVT